MNIMKSTWLVVVVTDTFSAIRSGWKKCFDENNMAFGGEGTERNFSVSEVVGMKVDGSRASETT